MNFDRPCRNKVQFKAVRSELYLKLAAFLFVGHLPGDFLTILSQKPDVTSEKVHEYLQLSFAFVALFDKPGYNKPAKREILAQGGEPCSLMSPD